MIENTILIFLLHETLSNKRVSLIKTMRNYFVKPPNLVVKKSCKYWGLTWLLMVAPTTSRPLPLLPDTGTTNYKVRFVKNECQLRLQICSCNVNYIHHLDTDFFSSKHVALSLKQRNQILKSRFQMPHMFLKFGDIFVTSTTNILHFPVHFRVRFGPLKQISADGLACCNHGN